MSLKGKTEEYVTDFKCETCGETKTISMNLKDYAYKLRKRSDGKTVYFCCYKCKRTAEKEADNYY